MATWVTNVGNEYGAILQCVVTSSVSNEGLGVMTEGQMKRYADAKVAAPFLLYTDNKCCRLDGHQSFSSCFTNAPIWKIDLTFFILWTDWPLIVLLKHIFCMALSCLAYQRQYLSGIDMTITSCLPQRRKNCSQRGWNLQQTKRQRKQLPKMNWLATAEEGRKVWKLQQRACKNWFWPLLVADSLGVPLFKHGEPSMASIFEEQRHHIPCIQDPEGVSLYTQISMVKKGNRRLPLYRCARGTTSVESFHCHLSTLYPEQAQVQWIFKRISLMEWLAGINHERMRWQAISWQTWEHLIKSWWQNSITS